MRLSEYATLLLRSSTACFHCCFAHPKWTDQNAGISTQELGLPTSQELFTRLATLITNTTEPMRFL